MLYVLSGTREQIIQQAHRLLRNIERYTATPDSLDIVTIDNYVSGGGLFDNAYGVVLDGCYQGEYRDVIENRLEDFRQSKTPVILLEEKLTAKDAKHLASYADKVFDFTQKKQKPKNQPLFAVSDAYLQCNKKSLWVTYHTALRAGFSSDEILNTLLWQVKNLVLVMEEKTNTGMHAFVYTKLQQAASKFVLDNVLGDLSCLVAMLYTARQGQGDLDGLIERWIIS